MKELEELTREIREKIPRLKELPIIGLDPMLNDVLEWFATKEITGLHFVTNHFINFSLKNNLPTVCGKWDLSKPYLKDQYPELITFLHSLIKTKQWQKDYKTINFLK